MNRSALRTLAIALLLGGVSLPVRLAPELASEPPSRPPVEPADRISPTPEVKGRSKGSRKQRKAARQ